MPSPVGHIIAGVATGWVTQAWPGASQPGRAAAGALPFVCALLALAPDADLLLPASHRTVTHSVGAVMAAGLAAAAIARWRRWPVAASVAVTVVALGSHLALDWLGRDSSDPVGIMALWPFSQSYFSSGLDLFMDVSRRYWLFDEIIVHNAKAAARELAIIGPFAAAAWYARRLSSRAPSPESRIPGPPQ
jgi:inner membrane protein